MKKVVLSAVILTAVLMSATAQTKKAMPVKTAQMSSMDMSSPTAKGKWLIGPALSLTSSTQDDGSVKSKHSIMAFQPEVGYFIADNLSVGLSLGISSDQTRVDGVATDKTSSFTLAPTLRYYLPISPKFQFLGKLQVPFGSVKTTLSNGNEVDVKSTLFGVQAIPAFAFFPSKKISIEMAWGSLYYISNQIAGGEKNSFFGLEFLNDDDLTGFIEGPTLGVKWHLGK